MLKNKKFSNYFASRSNEIMMIFKRINQQNKPKNKNYCYNIIIKKFKIIIIY